MAIHKLLKNVAVTGTVRFMDYVPEKTVNGEKWAAQVSLNGHWDDIGDAKIYLPHIVATAILSDGLAELLPHIEGQEPKFKWSYQGRVQVLKAEEGRSTRTTVLALDAKPEHIPVNGQPPRAQPVTSSDDPWAVLGNTYAKARQVAVKVWGADYDPTALVAATAAIFIESQKRGMVVQPTAQQTAEKIRTTFDNFDQPPPALAKSIKGEPDDALPW